MICGPQEMNPVLGLNLDSSVHDASSESVRNFSKKPVTVRETKHCKKPQVLATWRGILIPV